MHFNQLKHQVGYTVLNFGAQALGQYIVSFKFKVSHLFYTDKFEVSSELFIDLYVPSRLYPEYKE